MPTEEGQVAKVHDEGLEAEGVVQVSPQDQDGGIQVSPRVQVSPQEHFGGSQVAPQDQGGGSGGSQDSPRGQFGGGQASPRDQGGGSQVSPRVVQREPSITSRSGGVDKHRKLEAKPSLSIASGDHQAAKSSRRVKKSEDSLLKQKGRYSQWGYTRNGAVFSMGGAQKGAVLSMGRDPINSGVRLRWWRGAAGLCSQLLRKSPCGQEVKWWRRRIEAPSTLKEGGRSGESKGRSLVEITQTLHVMLSRR